MLAALLGVFSLFAAAPAQAQVWSATLTVDQSSAPTFFGCDNSDLSRGSCSDPAALTEDEFTHGGTTYTIGEITWQSTNDRLFFNLINVTGQATKTALSSLTLNVDGTALALSAATVDGGSIYWTYNPSPDWTDGQTVSLSLRTAAQQAALSDADLSGLTASTSTSASGTFTALTLSPSTFAAATTAYTASVANERTHVKITPTVSASGATVEVGKGSSLTAVTSGSASGAIALSVGANAITVKVTAQDGTTTKTYTVTVTRPQPPPTVSLSASPNPVTEGSSVTVTATLSRALSSSVTIPVTLADVTAESGDYGSLASITVSAGSTSGTGTISTNHDSGENDETFTVALGTLPSTVTAGSPSSVTVTIADDEGNIRVTLRPASFSVNEGKKAVLNLGFSGCENNNYVLIPIITTNVLNNQGNPINPPESGWRLSRGASGPRGSPGPDVLSYGPDHGFGHTLTPPVHSCGSGDVYIDTYRDCDIYDEKFTVELGTMPEGYVRGSQYKVTVTIIDDGGQEFCTRTPPPARQPTDQPPPNTEETDTGDGTPATPANTGGSGGGGGGFSGGTPAGGPPTGGGGGLPPSGSSDEPPPEDDELSTLCSQEDRETLGNFYETTGGEQWDENENWNSPEPLDQWYGVDTDDAGEVVSLRLSHNALSGEVPTRELLCLSELKELALWGNEEDLSGEVPEELVLRVERAVLRDIAEMLDLNPGWFENYGDPYNFEDWHEGVTTDDDGRVVELDLTGAEIPESVSELKRLREIMITSSGGGGCALNPKDDSSAFSLFLLALLVFAALGRKRARG